MVFLGVLLESGFMVYGDALKSRDFAGTWTCNTPQVRTCTEIQIQNTAVLVHHDDTHKMYVLYSISN